MEVCRAVWAGVVEVCEGIQRCVERCMEIHRGAWRYAEVHSTVCGRSTNSNQGQVKMYL